MWRCKWIELKLRQLQSQELKYEKELAAYDHSKNIKFALFDQSDTKSVPFSGRIRSRKVMKRKKRKRVEETCDVESYMSNHTVLSYYGNEVSCFAMFIFKTFFVA